MQRVKYNSGWEFRNRHTSEEWQQVTLPHDAMLSEKRLPNMPGGAAAGYFPGGKYEYRHRFYGTEQFRNQCVLLEFQGVYMKSTVLLNGEKVGERIYGYSRFYCDLTGKIRIGEENELLVIADNTQTPNSRWYSGGGIYRDVYLLTGSRDRIRPDGVAIETEKVDPPTLRVKAEVLLHRTNAEERQQMEVQDDRAHSYSLRAELLDGGQVIGTADREVPAESETDDITGENRHEVEMRLTVPNAELWSEEHPKCYGLKLALTENGETIDTHIETTGIRTLAWSAARGIEINGEPVKLRGGCIHHDNGILGACSFYDAELRRALRLKSLGFNAIRYSHNPAGEAFLSACDAAGIYVIVEAFDAWYGKMLDYDYGVYFGQEWKKDLGDMIRAARNHPSVIMYSIGNEISDTGMPDGPEINRQLNDFCHKLDSTRPTMHAFNPVVSNMGATNKTKTTPDDVVDPYREEKGNALSGSLLANVIATVAPIMSKVMGKPEKVEKLLKPCFDHIDIAGYNYADRCYEPHHQWNPDRIMIGSETYPGAIVSNWPYIEKHPFVVGDFMWTAWDYLGEAGIGVPIYGKSRGGFNRPYPCISGGNGAFNLIGEAETPAYIAAVVWGIYRKPYIAVRPVNHSGEKYFFGSWRSTDAVGSWSWSGCEDRKAEIEVYSIGAEIELVQNGRTLGRKPIVDFKASFETAWKPGILIAVSYDADGARIGESRLASAGEDTELRLTAETDGKAENLPGIKTGCGGDPELLFLKAEITDGKGIRKMLSDRELIVTVEGGGTLAAVGSADPVTEESYLGNHFLTHMGVLQIIVRRTGGPVKVTVKEYCGETAALSGILQASYYI